jgi:3-methylcrotonyl-CoA carboxylase alpha subunit
VIEAMKMEHSIKAPRDGVIAKVPFSEGDRCGPGDTLVELEP